MKAFVLLFLFCGAVFGSDHEPPSTYVFPTYYHTYGIHKAGSFELFLFLGLKVKFKNPQGLAVTRLNSWDDPNDTHDDDEVTVYGVNSGQNNIIYNKSMYALDVYGLDEPAEQRLNAPNGICANAGGDVYVADTGNHRIVRLFNPESHLQFVTAIGDSGERDGQFRFPRQVALDNAGNIYVADTGNNRVQVFDSTDSFVRAFSGNGRLTAPSAVAVTDSLERHAYLPSAFVITVDSANQRISKFTLQGQWVHSISTTKFAASPAHLEYITIDFFNQILITDSNNHCIHKLDKDLNYITSFGSYGDDDYQFDTPKGISIYRRFGQLFIAERNGAQYYWVGTDYKNFSFRRSGKRIFFEFELTEPSFITMDILDKDGKFVRRVAFNQRVNEARKCSYYWDGTMGMYMPPARDEDQPEPSTLAKKGQLLPPGKYTMRLKLEPIYSSRTYFEKIVEKEFDFRLKTQP